MVAQYRFMGHDGLMQTATAALRKPTFGASVSGKKPGDLPDQDSLLASILDQSGRGGVPVRGIFVQLAEPDGSGRRGSVLAEFVRNRDAAALDAYLLIHAAGSSEPWMVQYAIPVWVRALGLDQGAEPAAARGHWAKIASKLVRRQLIGRERRGNRVAYRLLDESGSGEPYTRPLKKSDGAWFSLPHVYWSSGHFRDFTLPEKAMLLIALDQKNGFPLPADRMPTWYGISPSTAKRGLSGLVSKGILTVDSNWRVDAKSATGWAEDRRYTTAGPYSTVERKAAMQTRPRKAEPVFFRPESEDS